MNPPNEGRSRGTKGGPKWPRSTLAHYRMCDGTYLNTLMSTLGTLRDESS